MRESQAVNIDPTGPMPPPDGSGTVVLNETQANIVLSAFAAFLVSAAALVSLLYWAESFANGSVPPAGDPVFAIIVKFGFLAIPALPFLFGELLSPPRLRIADAGVSLRRRGVTKTIGWSDLTEVNLQERTIRDRYGEVKSHTYCRVLGGGARLIVAPIFGVNPAGLAAYLQARGQSQTGGSIAVTQTPSTALPQHVRVQLSMLGILAAFAVVLLMLAAYGVVPPSPAH